jgi:hypothetical protein
LDHLKVMINHMWHMCEQWEMTYMITIGVFDTF